ncbi:erythromycin esterase family protein [Streptomyces sp. NPDC101191]|uniref:erythromycin esterase family protein n=1 Tax=Streptomyces sp. NPDC101191 TaxID=3366126 RepID=UPI003823312B
MARSCSPPTTPTSPSRPTPLPATPASRAFLRERLGAGLTFKQGSFNAFNHDGVPERFTAVPAAPGTAEHTLDKVRYRAYVVDLRNAPTAACTWLAEPHTIKNIGATYPVADAPRIRLTQTHDVLIHLQQVQAAHMLN